MKTERKNWVALATLLIIFSGIAAAASTYTLTLDPTAPVEGSTLFVTVLKDGNPEPGVMVQFVLNNGLPVFNMTNDQGKARFKPSAEGNLNIYAATQDGILLASKDSIILSPTDITAPSLVVDQPTNGQVFNTSSITVSGTASDASGIASVTVNGAAATGTTIWSKIITLTTGTNTITVVARDGAGNTATVTRTVTYTPTVVDTTPPVLTVEQPINGQIFGVSSITVSGTASDASGIASVTVNGAAATGTTIWNKTITLTTGTNTITVVATDYAGITATVTRTVTYTPTVVDTTAPSLVVDQPTNGQVFNTSSITVSGTASDASGIASVTVNGATATGITNWSKIITLTTGTNTITAVATDNAGNTATVTRTVTYTPTPTPGPTPTPTPTPGPIDVPLPIDPTTGTVNTTIIVAAPSANITITIPNGTKAVDANGNPLTNISINTNEILTTNASFALSANDNVLGSVVQLKPEGARFDPPIQIRFNYSLPLPSGVEENSLTVRYFNASTNNWEVMVTVERNTVQHYIIANIPHFSAFALIGTSISGGGSSGGSIDNSYIIPKTATSASAPAPAVVPTTASTLPQPLVTSENEGAPTGTSKTAGTLTGILAGVLGFGLPGGEGSVSIYWIVGLIILVVAIYIVKRKMYP